ncbi:MAG: sugar transferase [Gammaproteobacteria bacterium]
MPTVPIDTNGCLLVLSPKRESEAVRRSADLLIALFAGLLLSPAVFVIALLVRVSMGRPVFFMQARIGRDGVPFQLVKFRTMTNARIDSGRLLSDEARITPLGRFLRRTRLDELPELLNVVKGEMSLVGPRPWVASTLAALGEAGRHRSAVRPGLTGWAQVNGNTRLSDTDKLALDLWYIDHRSLALGVAILLRTLGVVLRGERIVTRRLEQARAYALHRYRVG